jgi:hypothetical protein
MTTQQLNNYIYGDDEVNVPLTELIDNKGFTENNLKVHTHLFDTLKVSHQKVYGDKNGEGIVGGLKFIGKKLIHRDLIDSDYKHGKQNVRAERNELEDEIQADIRKNGFSLSEIPVAVEQKADGTYKVLEGRTRYSYYMINGFEYILCDVYEHVNEEEKSADFSFFMNNYGKKKGFAKKEDLVLFLTTEIQSEDAPCEGMGRNEIVKWIKGREKALGTTLTPSQHDNLVHTAIEHLTGAKPIYTFNNANDVKKWLTDCGYHDTDKVRYVPITSDVWNGTKSLMRTKKIMREDGFTGEIRGIIWSGTLKGSNPVSDWKFRNLNLFKRQKAYLSELAENFFDSDVFADEIDVGFYACVPQCEELKKKYPMDKLVIYGDYK